MRVGLVLRQKVSLVGNVVNMIVFVVLGIEPSVRSDVECLRLSQAGSGLSGGGSFGLDRGLLVLVGSLGLLEDVDDVLALVVG